LGASSVFYALSRNILWKLKNKKRIFEGIENESLGRKIIALISGYKVKISKLDKGHLFPLEDIEIDEEGNYKRKLLTFPNYEEREEIISRITDNIENEKLGGGVWATPGLPLLIFITVGLIIAITYGDIVWVLISSILR
jgi:hypothetical protein